MSPFRATLLHSPGWNEGKARYGTLGTHRQKRIELLQERHFQRARLVCIIMGMRSFVLRLEECRSYGAQRMRGTINPGLGPWAMKKYRPVGVLRRQHHDNECAYSRE